MKHAKTLSTIERIREILRKLYVQAKAIDSKLPNTKPNSPIKNRLFSQECFKSKSRKYLPYIIEIEQELQHAELLLAKNQHEFLSYQIEKIELQCSAIITALNAADSLKAIDKYNKEHFNKSRLRRQLTQVMQPIQDLYAKLSETHEFERRLIEMLQQKERQLADTKTQAKELLTSEILTLHQRLGRCRQAISKLEREIEQHEKRN